MKTLFVENWDKIKAGTIAPKMQQGEGSYHTMADLQKYREKCEFSWNDTILEYKKKMDEMV